MSEGPQSQQEVAMDMQEHFRQRILHTLGIFPFISQSMIHIGIGTANMTSLWKPVLQTLVDRGEILITEVTASAPSERRQVYSVYHLPTMEYPGNKGTQKVMPASNPQN